MSKMRHLFLFILIMRSTKRARATSPKRAPYRASCNWRYGHSQKHESMSLRINYLLYSSRVLLASR